MSMWSQFRIYFKLSFKFLLIPKVMEISLIYVLKQFVLGTIILKNRRKVLKICPIPL